MFKVSIDRPADGVFAFLADAHNNPVWQQGMEHCHWTTTPPIREGSIYEQEAKMLGKAISSTFEVKGWAERATNHNMLGC